MKKVYLGDAVYAAFDGHDVILTTENGIEATNKIYMEPEVVQSFQDFIRELREIPK